MSDYTDNRATIIVLVIVVIVFVWVYVIQPLIEWIKQNILLVGFVVAILIILILTVLYYLGKELREKRIIEASLEREYKTRGLSKYIRNGVTMWGTPEQIEYWRKMDEKAQLINRVAEAIKAYHPPRQLRDEYAYQMGLHGFLQNQFKEVEVEVQRGHSRPDIVIGDIAIEIKGPSDSVALMSVSDKAMRYMQHFKYLIVVLFEPQFNEGRYQEWLRGMERTFSSVIVIRK